MVSNWNVKIDKEHWYRSIIYSRSVYLCKQNVQHTIKKIEIYTLFYMRQKGTERTVHTLFLDFTLDIYLEVLPPNLR